MKERTRLSAAGLAAALALGLTPSLTRSAERPHTHEKALRVETEDPVLKEQIVKLTQSLDQFHHQMAQKRAIQATTDEAQKSALYAELDILHKEHDMLDRLLHDLIFEAQATEWTRGDEALRRIKPFERRQEQELRQEEALRDRKDKE